MTSAASGLHSGSCLSTKAASVSRCYEKSLASFAQPDSHSDKFTSRLFFESFTAIWTYFNFKYSPGIHFL